jgi:hypothetical protein
MVHRDPDTGQFVGGDGSMHGYDDIEFGSFRASIGIPAADLDGGTGFGGQTDTVEGLELLDYDDLVDRNERLDLLYGMHSLTVYANSTETADGTVRFEGEVASAPSPTMATNIAVQDIEGDVDGATQSTDSIDLLGRRLNAVGHAPFSDTATGVGGSGSAGEDRVDFGMPPGPAREFHPRDELFLNGEFRTWNIDDGGVHLELAGQHWYGVSEE